MGRFIGSSDDIDEWAEGITALVRTGFRGVALPPTAPLGKLMQHTGAAVPPLFSGGVYSIPGGAFDFDCGNSTADVTWKLDNWANTTATQYHNAGFDLTTAATFAMSDEPGWYFPAVLDTSKWPNRVFQSWHEYLQNNASLSLSELGAASWEQVCLTSLRLLRVTSSAYPISLVMNLPSLPSFHFAAGGTDRQECSDHAAAATTLLLELPLLFDLQRAALCRADTVDGAIFPGIDHLYQLVRHCTLNPLTNLKSLICKLLRTTTMYLGTTSPAGCLSRDRWVTTDRRAHPTVGMEAMTGLTLVAHEAPPQCKSVSQCARSIYCIVW